MLLSVGIAVGFILIVILAIEICLFGTKDDDFGPMDYFKEKYMLNEKLRLQILNGALRDYKSDMAGVYDGYYVSLGKYSELYTIAICASSPNDPGNSQLYNKLQKIKAEYPKQIVSATVREFSAQIQIKAPGLLKKLPDIINNIVPEITRWLKTQEYTTGCQSCGAETTGNYGETVRHYMINGVSAFLCQTCANKIENELLDRQYEISSQKSRLVPGLVGALLGSLIGVVLWVVVYHLGYIAGIAGLIMVICAMKGYEILGGCLDKKGVILSALLSVAMIYLANRIAWSWEFYTVFKENRMNRTFAEVFTGLHGLLDYYDVKGSFYGDMAMGVVLSLVASVSRIIQAFRQSAGSYKMEQS